MPAHPAYEPLRRSLLGWSRTVPRSVPRSQRLSSGQAEGQITRLKLLKRQMYGRAGFDLRTLLAA
jgi:transposase